MHAPPRPAIGHRSSSTPTGRRAGPWASFRGIPPSLPDPNTCLGSQRGPRPPFHAALRHGDHRKGWSAARLKKVSLAHRAAILPTLWRYLPAYVGAPPPIPMSAPACLLLAPLIQKCAGVRRDLIASEKYASGPNTLVPNSHPIAIPFSCLSCKISWASRLFVPTRPSPAGTRAGQDSRLGAPQGLVMRQKRSLLLRTANWEPSSVPCPL